MKQIVQILLTAMFTVFLLATAACESEPVTPTTSPQVIEIVPSPTIPPVASPTIVIPEVTKTAPPTVIAPSATAVPEQVSGVETISTPIFASYNPAQVDAVPAMFHEPIAPDMSNVLVPFALSPDQLSRLGLDGVVVSPGVEKEFFTVYEKARYDNVPIFVTSDSLLHSYHLIFDKVLRTAERQAFIPLLSELNKAMLAQADAQYQSLQGSAWEDAARRAVAFIGVGAKLLDPEVTVPDYAQELVQAELALVEAAAGIQASPLFPAWNMARITRNISPVAITP